jgi:outer membrane protein assembly factor BamB
MPGSVPLGTRAKFMSIGWIVALLSACGGGGGNSGGGASVSSASMSVSPSSISVTATTVDQAPTATIRVEISSVDVPVAAVDVTGSNNGIASASAPSPGSTTVVTIIFKSPSALGPGTYSDNVTIKACQDTQCQSQFANSPQTIPVQFTVTQAVPTVASLSPSSAHVGDGPLTVTVVGSNFTAQSVLQWGGSARPTTVVSATQLTAVISATDLAAAATVPVTVVTGSATSSAVNFAIQKDGPLQASYLSPSIVAAGGSGFVLNVIGTGFTASSSIQWNGTSLATILVSGTHVQASVPASDIATMGTVAITVKNPQVQGGLSSSLNITIAPALPDAVAFQITPAHSGSIFFKTTTLPVASSWSVDVGGTPSYALIAAGKVVVTVSGTSGSQLLALDQETGATAWGPVSLAGSAAAAYDGGAVFVISGTSGAETLQAFDVTTGAVKWSQSLSTQTFFTSAPTALNGLVYISGASSASDSSTMGSLLAIDESDGSTSWSKPVEGGADSSPAVSADGVYASYPCSLYDFDPATGTEIWGVTKSCTDNATPVLGGGLLFTSDAPSMRLDGVEYTASGGEIQGNYLADAVPAIGTTEGYFLQSGAVRATNLSSNTVDWSFSGDGHLVTSPLIMNSYVIVGSSTGNVYVLDSSNGSVIWQGSVAGTIPSAPGADAPIPLSGLTAGDGLLVVPAGTTLTAFTLSTNP